MQHKFVGNGAYCYANSTAMLLSSIGQDVSPATLEVLSGVGLGATWFPKENSALMGNIATAPDQGITAALDLLGFEYVEKNADASSPMDELRRAVSKGPASVGPLDMGFLRYNPFHKYLSGVDHFAFIYKVDNDRVYLHDPEGFPNVSLPSAPFLESWKAEKIQYRRGSFRYWTSPKRKHVVNSKDLGKAALSRFKKLYHESESICQKLCFPQGRKALEKLADNLASGVLGEGQKERLVNFAFPVSSRRSSDYADFFASNNLDKMAQLKQEHSESFGKCQVSAMESDWKSVCEELRSVASKETEFRDALLES